MVTEQELYGCVYSVDQIAHLSGANHADVALWLTSSFGLASRYDDPESLGQDRRFTLVTALRVRIVAALMAKSGEGAKIDAFHACQAACRWSGSDACA